ncbi:MAG TPA: hypothetical protein VGD56_01515 [Gemmatirosa sp.]
MKRRPAAAPKADVSTPARLDGRRAHVLDRAAEYVRLADQGLTAAQIARRRRKSPAHVSILLRLGRALATVPDTEREALRSPRVTWRLVQRLVRTDVDVASLRKQLRDAVGGFSTHNVDRRQGRARRAAAGPPTAPPAPGVAWGWDATWFADDPIGYAAAHLAHLAHVHTVIAGRAADAVRLRAGGSIAGIDAGQSLRGLQRRLRQATDAAAPPSAAEQQALATLTIVGRALREAEAAVAALQPAHGIAPPGPASVAAATVSDADLAADLDEG